MSNVKSSFFFVEIWGRQKSVPVVGGRRVYWNAEYYTFKDVTEEDTSLRDDRHCDELVECLIDKSSAWRNEKPVAKEGFVPWFSIVIGVSQTRKNISHYTVDFSKAKGCPLEVIGIGMDIYRLIKRNIRNAIISGRAKK